MVNKNKIVYYECPSCGMVYIKEVYTVSHNGRQIPTCNNCGKSLIRRSKNVSS